MRRTRQQGAALIIMLTVLVLGTTWYVFDALAKASSTRFDREMITATALKKAKEALLAHVALTAASTSELYPGRLPCPEVRSQVGTVASPGSNVGRAGPFSGVPCDAVGRLPWKTLGVDPIRDGHGELLWYAVPQNGTWALTNEGDALTSINPGLGNQLTYDGTANAVVAVIIAPGPPLDTTALGTPPAGCAAVNQFAANRYAATLAVANFLECGNATGSYVTAGNSDWINDRSIAITAAEVMDAIAGAIQERLQRQVAPALAEWRSTTSLSYWNARFLPYASSFAGDPAANDQCGNNGVWEGILPTAKSSTSCVGWTAAAGTYSGSVQSGLSLAPLNCAMSGVNVRCTFTGLSLSALSPFRMRVSLRLQNVASAFRAPVTASNISVTGVAAPVTVTMVSTTVNAASNYATVVFDVSKSGLIFVSLGFVVTVTPPGDAPILSDSRLTWLLNNRWNEYVYYAAAPGMVLNPTAGCSAPTSTTGCLITSGIDSGTGASNDRTLVLAYMNRRLSGQPTPCTSAGECLEGQNASTADRTFANAVASSAFNDRLAVCPFRLTTMSGATPTVTTLCN